MDVKSKNSSGPLLQKSMSRPAPSSVTRADGYVHVQGPKPLPASSPSSLPSGSTQGGVRSAADSKCAKAAESDATAAVTTDISQSPAPTLCIPGDPVNPVNPTEEQVVRKTLATMMDHGRGDFLGRKHHYFSAQGVVVGSGAEAGYVINQVVLGSAWNQRVGTQVRQTRLRIRCYVYMYNITDVTANTTPVPILRIFLKWTKVPIAPGTLEATISADSIPPGATSAIYSGLSIAPTAQSALTTAVFNPGSVSRYHEINGITLPPSDMYNRSTTASTNGPNLVSVNATQYILTPKTYFFEWDHEFDRMSTFQVASNIAVANQLEMSFFPIYAVTQALSVSFTADLEFEDVTAG